MDPKLPRTRGENIQIAETITCSGNLYKGNSWDSGATQEIVDANNDSDNKRLIESGQIQTNSELELNHFCDTFPFLAINIHQYSGFSENQASLNFMVNHYISPKIAHL